MKEIVAIIRSNAWQKTRRLLLEEHFSAYTVQRVLGRGRQKGLSYLSGNGKAVTGIRYLPKRMVTLFVNDDEAERAVEVLIRANRTGEIGDGKIFVLPLDGASRIRTGELAQAALA